MSDFQVTVKHNLDPNRVDDVLDNGFAWSLPWMRARWTHLNGERLPNMVIGVMDEGSWEDELANDSLKLQDNPENGIYELTDARISKGLQVLADDYPHLMQEILEENDDANTGDVLLQCCLFGEERYS